MSSWHALANTCPDPCTPPWVGEGLYLLLEHRSEAWPSFLNITNLSSRRLGQLGGCWETLYRVRGPRKNKQLELSPSSRLFFLLVNFLVSWPLGLQWQNILDSPSCQNKWLLKHFHTLGHPCKPRKEHEKHKLHFYKGPSAELLTYNFSLHIFLYYCPINRWNYLTRLAPVTEVAVP